MPKTRNWLTIKTDAFTRKIIWHYLSGKLPFYLVNEYPKSGGSWFAQMLSDYLKIPFTRNKIPRIFPPKPQVLQGHHRYHSGIESVFCVIRDGRDVMVSQYYHDLFVHESGLNWHEVETTRKGIGLSDLDDIHANLPKFIQYKFTCRQLPRFTWTEFCRDWLNKDVPIIKYEEMLADTKRAFSSALKLGLSITPNETRIAEVIEKYQFSKLAGRQAGDENVQSFLRKGIAGDWVNKFSPEARMTFHRFAGDMLIELGYEKDDNWVTET